MKILDKIAHRLGYTARKQVRAMTPGWQAASINRLTNAWTSSTLSIDSIIRKDLSTLRARSRDMAENNDYAKRFLWMLKNNVVGEMGVRLKNKAKDAPSAQHPQGRLDDFANRVIERHWNQWGKKGNCTADRRLTFIDLQNLLIENIAKDGELLLRKVRGFDNPAEFALAPVESDMLDIELNRTLGNGRQIRMGVELNEWREPIAYHIRQQNPADTYNAITIDPRHERVPASDMFHLFLALTPNQTRGVPWMATPMFRMNMLGKYEEAEVTASRAAASKMAFLTKTGANVEYQGDDLDGNKVMDAEPGAIEELPMGMDIKALDWSHPNSSYGTFMKTCLRGVAAGLNVSYNTLANDMESVNFASGKLGLESERDYWRAIQRWFIGCAVSPIFTDWLEVQLFRQHVKLPRDKKDKFDQPDWRPRRWAYVNPQQEVSARIQAVNAGFTSISRVIAEQGLDRDELFEEIASDKEAAEVAGISFMETPMAKPAEAVGDDDGSQPLEPGDDGVSNEQATKTGNIQMLKVEMDAYGVAVRAGVVTPSVDDENFYRKKLGLPPLSKDAAAAWKKDGNIKRPITLTPPKGEVAPAPGVPTPQQKPEDDLEDD